MAHDRKDIEELWIRYVEGRVTPEELNDLFASLQDVTQEAEHTFWAQHAAMHADSDLPADPHQEEAVWQRLLSQADGLRQSLVPAPSGLLKRIHVLRKWGWAASVVFVLGIGAYLWTSNKRNTPTAIVAAKTIDIAPGRDGAILTLADGTEVVLDSLGTGLIARQPGAEVLLKDNALSYDVGGSAGGESVYNTMTTPKGRQFRLTLPDGTKAWLNAGSSIRYPTAFTGVERHVEVSGEVYLEVAKNTKMPFRVNVNNQAEVEVLGTHFNINAYEQEENIRTTLLEGSVRVSKRLGNVTLKPGQQAQVASTIHVVDNVDLNGVVAWKNGLFNFEGQPLRMVMRQLERWYDIEVVYTGNVPDVVFRGKVFRNLELSNVLYILQKMGVKFEMEGRTLTVTG